MRFRSVAPLFVAMLACRSYPPAPPYTQQPTSALSEIPFPPPPARAESVPPEPRRGAVWIDGEWRWEARRWAWRVGRWVMPPRGARFAPWATVRDGAGTLYMARGVWRAADGSEIEEPPPLAEGLPGTAPVVDPTGERVPAGPSRSVDSETPSRDAALPTAPEAPDGGTVGDVSLMETR